MLKQVKGFLVADFKNFFADRINLFWIVVWPILLMVLASYLWLPKGEEAITLLIGLCSEDKESEEMMKNIMENVTYGGKKLFAVRVYNSSEAMLRDLESARLDGGIYLPEGFWENVTSISRARLFAYISGEDPLEIQINKGIIRSFLYEFQEETAKRKAGELKAQMPVIVAEIMGPLIDGIARPLEISVEERIPTIFAKRPMILGWYLIGVLAMLYLYAGLSFGAAAIIEEKESGRLERMVAAGVPISTLFAGKMTVFLAILSIPTVLLVITGLLLGARLEWSPSKVEHLLVLLNILLIYIMTVHLGFVLSLVARRTSSATSLGTIIGLLISFTTGILFPKDMLPGFMIVLAEASPITWATDLIRGALVYNMSFGELAMRQALVLLATGIIVAIGISAYKKTLSRYIEL